MNKNLEIWEDIFQNNEWGKYPSLAVVRFVARNFYKVPNRKDIRILELGCGTGANLWYCAREGFSVIGLDGSKTALNTMISRFNAEHLNSNLIYARDGDYSLTIEDIEDDSHERHEGEHENPSHRLRRLSVVEQDADDRRNHDCDIEQQINPMEINHILILIKY